MTKYIVVTGGVLSGLGKGIATASIGRILEGYGFKVTFNKLDPYMNYDCGTMNPIEHGEVFILDDGTEVDMDFGHYERFLGISVTGNHNITSGKAFKSVIDKERKGEYLGQTVQIIPHVTNEIKERIKKSARGTDICLVEIGGTVGDIENLPFLEAVRQMRIEEGPENVIFIHVTLIPVLEVVGEQKTKPTQHSVQRLRETGIEPDILIGRSKLPLEPKIKKKLALFCNISEDAIFSSPDLKTIYQLPIVFDEEGIGKIVLKKLGLKQKKTDLKEWRNIANSILHSEREVTIAITGKYTKLRDSYVSIKEALIHAGAIFGATPVLKWVETEDFEKNPELVNKKLGRVNGILVPGGFGSRGVEGKIMSIKYARENNIPFLGLCYGFQLATIEFSRNVCGLAKANTTENNSKTPHPVIDILPEQKKVKDKGGTMRLGSYPAVLEKNSLVRKLYEKKVVNERHRHRYEVNPRYIKILEKNGLRFSGKSPNGRLMEYLELPTHPYFVGTQSHPELKSRPDKPSPLFTGFMRAATETIKQ